VVEAGEGAVWAKGAAGFRDELARMEPLVDVLWRQVLADRPLDTPERRAGFRRDLAEAVGRIADKSVQDAYRQETHRRLDDLFRSQPKPAFQAGSGQFGGQFGGQKGRFPGRQVPMPVGGEAAKRGVANIQRTPYELILLTLVNHPDLIGRHSGMGGEVEVPRGDFGPL